ESPMGLKFYAEKDKICPGASGAGLLLVVVLAPVVARTAVLARAAVASLVPRAALATVLTRSPIVAGAPLWAAVAARHVAIISCRGSESSRPCGRWRSPTL